MVSQGNIPKLFSKIIDGTPPEKYNVEHLKGLGFKSSNDRGFIPLLKDLNFLSSDGTPLQSYHEYRDQTKSQEVLGNAILETYGDLFSINENPTSSDRKAIEGKFKTVHGSNEKVSKLQAATFLTLLGLSDIDAAREQEDSPVQDKVDKDAVVNHAIETPPSPKLPSKHSPQTFSAGLHYNIQIHLPATKDIEVYNAIFKSIKNNLYDD
jgi:hypothetical protein